MWGVCLEWLLGRLAYESTQVVSHAIQPPVLAVRLGFSDGRCLSEFSLDSPWGGWQRGMASDLRVCQKKDLFHLLKELLLCSNAQIIGVQETCVGMNRLVICIYVEQQRGKHAALWKAILLSAPSAAFADEVHKKRLFDIMFWISSVSLTSCFISKNFLVSLDSVAQCREIDKGSSSDSTFLYPSSMNCVRFRSWLVQDFLRLKPACSV